jgi:hypothetical protein
LERLSIAVGTEQSSPELGDVCFGEASHRLRVCPDSFLKLIPFLPLLAVKQWHKQWRYHIKTADQMTIKMSLMDLQFIILFRLTRR